MRQDCQITRNVCLCVCVCQRETRTHLTTKTNPLVKDKGCQCGEGSSLVSISHFLVLQNNMHCPCPKPPPAPGVWSAITHPPWECCCLAGWQKPHPHTQVASSGGSPLNLEGEERKSWERCRLSESKSVGIMSTEHICVTKHNVNTSINISNFQ